MEDYAEETKRIIEGVESRNGWNAFYQEIRVVSSKYNFSCRQAKSQENIALNRYRDVSPYDHSRVILRDAPSDYINASEVKVEDAGRYYVLTQGALPNTAGHFWLMVWERKSRGILMLNKVIEKNQVKCYQYWPLGTKTGESSVMEFNDVQLRVHLLSEEEYRHFIIRKLEVEEISTGNRREVLQFHYITWPDFGVPSTPRSFLHFLQIVRDADVLSSKYGPAVVHCSAGIGRSGTFCLVDSCLLMMEKGLPVNVKEVLLDMRKYRMGLIQTADQLRFSYLAILEGCQQLSNGNKKFLPDTEENGIGIIEKIVSNPSPQPPKRTYSLSPTEEQYKRLLADRPLPPVPDSSSDESSVDDLIEDDDDDDDDDTTSTSYGLLDHVNGRDQTPLTSERKSSVSEVENIREDSSRRSSEGSVNPIDNIVDSQSEHHHKQNGLEEAELRRRLKNEATREKIREIRTKQKESEARQGFYRTPKRRKK